MLKCPLVFSSFQILSQMYSVCNILALISLFCLCSILLCILKAKDIIHTFTTASHQIFLNFDFWLSKSWKSAVPTWQTILTIPSDFKCTNKTANKIWCSTSCSSAHPWQQDAGPKWQSGMSNSTLCSFYACTSRPRKHPFACLCRRLMCSYINSFSIMN